MPSPLESVLLWRSSNLVQPQNWTSRLRLLSDSVSTGCARHRCRSSLLALSDSRVLCRHPSQFRWFSRRFPFHCIIELTYYRHTSTIVLSCFRRVNAVFPNFYQFGAMDSPTKMERGDDHLGWQGGWESGPGHETDWPCAASLFGAFFCRRSIRSSNEVNTFCQWTSHRSPSTHNCSRDRWANSSRKGGNSQSIPQFPNSPIPNSNSKFRKFRGCYT